MKRSIALAASLATLLILAAPALAGETQTWDTTWANKSAYVRAQMTVDYSGKRMADIKGWVQDVCPGDGYGAYLKVSRAVGPKDYNQWKWKTFYYAKDDNGCGNGKVHFDPAAIRVPKGVVIRSVSAALCQKDVDGGGNGYCKQAGFKNPYG